MVALHEGILYVQVLQPTLHYELEQISKVEILRKLKQRFGGKITRDIGFRIGLTTRSCCSGAIRLGIKSKNSAFFRELHPVDFG